MSGSFGRPSTFTKMRQVYYEAKQSFNKSLGQHEDNFIVSSDNDLDTRFELLQAADNSFNTLMRVILKYRDILQDLVNIQENFSLALIEYGTKDSTAAGNVMRMSGKAISKAAQRQIQMKTSLMNLFHEVQTFQFKATTDALQTVAKMEKVRRSYRSGLMWLKNESTDLDPDVGKKLRNFRKVQEHIKHLKVKFDGVKLETMQKIDLFLLSRSNLFSNTLVSYCKAFKKICKSATIYMDYTLENIPLCLSYNFVALKELNQYSKNLRDEIQKKRYLEQMSKKQRSVDQIQKFESTSSLSDQSTYMSPSEQSSSSKSIKSDKSEDIKKNERNSPQLIFPSQSAEDTSLIDLNDEKDNQNLMKFLMEDKHPSSFKYSKDLLSINFGDYRTKYRSELFTDTLEESIKHLLVESESQDNFEKETKDLEFWSLIKSCDKTSNLTESKSADMDDSGANCPKHAFSTASVSKWDNILIEFDPYFEEMTDRKFKTDSLEQC